MTAAHPEHVTPAVFLAAYVGHKVALLIDDRPNVQGQLAAVEGDPEHPTLVVTTTAGDEPVALADCSRVKFHFSRKDHR